MKWAICVPSSLANEVILFCLETTLKQIEDAFKEFTTKEDIAIVLISQYVSVSCAMTYNVYVFSLPVLLSMQVKNCSNKYTDEYEIIAI